jgi:HK97 family phage portal protein
MAWYNNVFSRAGNKRTHEVELETKSVIGTDSFRQFLVYGALENANTPKAAFALYETSTAVAIPINKVAEKFASLTPIIMIGAKKLTTHPLLDLLFNPCPDFSQELFFLNLAINYLVAGETFVISLGLPSGPPKQLYPLTPTNIEHGSEHGFVTHFEVTGDHFTGRYILKDGMFWSTEGIRKLDQIRNYSSKNNSMYRGRSKLIAASDTARQQVLGTKHNLSILEKGGKLSLLFHFDSDMDDDEFQIVKRRIQSQFGGADKAGSTMITAGGSLSVEQLSQTAVDMDWAGAQKLSANVLALTYDYPLPLLTLDAATMSNYQTALEALYDDAVIPLCKVIYGEIQRSMFKRFKLPEDSRLTFDDEKVPALVRRRNEHVTNRQKLGVESDNEIRNMLGREDYVGGDIIYKPSTMVPVGDDFLTDDDDPDDINLPDDDDDDLDDE